MPIRRGMADALAPHQIPHLFAQVCSRALGRGVYACDCVCVCVCGRGGGDPQLLRWYLKCHQHTWLARDTISTLPLFSSSVPGSIFSREKDRRCLKNLCRAELSAVMLPPPHFQSRERGP